MGFSCGIIGLPNVGKSTIFNALSGAGAQMANYPFCTIEPNKGIVPVPDRNLSFIGEITGKSDPIPTRIEFVDVAGLVEGASKGEGLGNKFLGHIRGTDALIHIVRCFNDSNVVHVSGEIGPLNDIETINTELMLADMEVLEKAREKAVRLAGSGDKKARQEIDIIDALLKDLNEGVLLKNSTAFRDADFFPDYGLITVKPVLYCANIGEGDDGADIAGKVRGHAGEEGSGFLTLSGQLEEEISELPREEKQEFLLEMGLEESGLDRLIRAGYGLLDLITYYTMATDLQAWTVRKGTPAVKAAGKIHTDFERGFIRAEVMKYKDLIDLGSEQGVKEKGLLRSEGKDYIIEEHDIVKYLFNV